MLEYEWGMNPSTMMLPGDDEMPDQNRHVYDQYTSATTTHSFHHHHHHHDNNNNNNNNLAPQQHNNHGNTTTTFFHHLNTTSFYDPRAAPFSTAPHPSLLSLDHHHHPQQQPPIPDAAGGGPSYFLVPKNEDISRDFTARIGLNLGGRTYFSSAEDEFVSRLYRRSRPLDSGSGPSVPRCQAEGCNVDLTDAKHYHRRHKVCQFHSKASTVIAAGLTQRFCQQCSRFHLLSEFDNGKRSCRKRLADHNRRRRKSNHTNNNNNINNNNQDPNHKSSSPMENARNFSSENLARSPPESSSGAHSYSSVTVAASPPRMSLDCFKQSPYQATASSSSACSSSLFFTSG